MQSRKVLVTKLQLCSVLYLASSPPLNVTATTVSATVVQVSWSPPDMLNGMIRYYTVIYGIDGSSNTTELNSTGVSTMVTDLDPFTSYVFYVVAFTVELSNRSESDTAMTAEAGNISLPSIL